MKLKVITPFQDKDTKKIYYIGAELDADDARAKELIEKRIAVAIGGEASDKKVAKAPKTPEAPESGTNN
jgi:hypothetical protein